MAVEELEFGFGMDLCAVPDDPGVLYAWGALPILTLCLISLPCSQHFQRT